METTHRKRYRYCPTPNRYGMRTVAIQLPPEDWRIWRRYVLDKGESASSLGRKAIMSTARAELAPADAVAAAKPLPASRT